MKKLLLFIPALVVVFSITSCKKLLEIKEQLFSPIDINVPAFQVVVPPIPIVPANEVSLGAFATRFNLDSAIKANTAGVFGIGAISSIRIKQMTINVLNADQANNLSNFESARLGPYSSSNASPTEIAVFSFPDEYSTSSTYAPVNGPDLKAYFKADEITYTLAGKARRPVLKALTLSVATTVSVK